MRLLSLWGPVLAHMALIFIASSSSDPSPLPSRVSDKLLHVGAYALLGALLLRALAPEGAGGMTWGRALVAVVLATVYGVTDEWHQSFVPGRTPDARDLVADFAGALAGAVMLALAATRWRRRRTPPRAPS